MRHEPRQSYGIAPDIPNAERFGLIILPCDYCSGKQGACRHCCYSGKRFTTLATLGAKQVTHPRMQATTKESAI